MLILGFNDSGYIRIIVNQRCVAAGPARIAGGFFSEK